MTKAKSALLVIDVQNHFVTDRSRELPAKIADHITKNAYTAITFTAFVNQPGSNFERILDIHNCYGPPDTDINSVLTPFITTDNFFKKTAKSAFRAPGLIEYLATKKIETIDICGLDIDDCVLATIFEAFDLGYNFTVLKELAYISHPTDEVYDAALKIIEKNLSAAAQISDHLEPN